MAKAENGKPQKTSVEEVGKMNLIERLLSQTGTDIPESVRDTESGDYLWINSHKLLLEGLDFDLIYTPLKHLGYKAILSLFGPIYAKNHTPCSVSVNLGLSKKYFAEDIEELWSGMVAALEEHKVKSVHLNLLPSLTGLTISLSSVGKQKRELFVQTPKPISGDLICITGNLGAAYMGLQLLEREKALFIGNPNVQPNLENYTFILKSYLNPYIDTSAIESLNQNSILPSDGVFISDGLADAVKRVCKKNNLGAKVFLDKIPIASQTFKMAEELNIDAITAALNGGDDFQFLYTIPLSKYESVQKEIPQLDIIGHLCSADYGTLLITPDGAELQLKAQGWSE
ncbi:MAG: thiamine-phosphate kinase [Rikenellaceae bacterium]